MHQGDLMRVAPSREMMSDLMRVASSPSNEAIMTS
jgi:hypothetical protein